MAEVTQTTAGQPVAQEPAALPGEALHTDLAETLDAILMQRDAENTARITDHLRTLIKPDISKRPQLSSSTPSQAEIPAVGYGEWRDRRDVFYLERIPNPEKRKLRNPKMDPLYQRWLQAHVDNRREEMLRLDLEMNDAMGWQRALAEGTPPTGPSGGGALVPQPLAAAIVLARNDVARIRRFATVYESTSQSLRVPISSALSATMVAEGAQAAAADPTLTTGVLQLRKCQVHVSASIEMLMDSAFNLVDYFTSRAGSAIGAREDLEFGAGAGVAPGVTESIESATITTVTTAATLTYGHLVDLFYAVPDAEMSDAVWMANAATLGFMSRVTESGTGSRPVLMPPTEVPRVAGDLPAMQGTIFGRPVIRVPFTTNIIRVGNLAKYVILSSPDLRISTSEHTLWSTDQVAWKITARFDGLVAEEGAFREASIAATGAS